jgi:thioredoxin-related protein
VDFRDQNNDDFEVVFVSSDRSPDAQMSYMKEANMKWYTLEHRSQDANKLSQKFGIRGIPALIIVSPDGETITTNGRGEVSSNPSQAIKKWKQSS